MLSLFVIWIISIIAAVCIGAWWASAKYERICEKCEVIRSRGGFNV